MIAFPFDSRIVSYDADGMPIYDRASNAEHFAGLLASFLSNGLFGSEMCEVLVDGGMSVKVATGNALIEGRYAYVDTPETLTFDPSEGLARMDTVVLRRDLSSDVNYVVAAIVKGTESTTPERPALTRDGTVWELGLADVLIPANSTAVYQQNITDTRLEDERCGIVAAILTDVDTTHFYDQIKADLASFKKNEQAQFEAWFETIQGILEGDVAAKLATEILKKAEFKSWTSVLAADRWSGQDEFAQTIAVDGILNSDNPDVDIDLSAVVISAEMQAVNDAWSGILKAQSGDGTITFYFSAVPEIDIPIKIKVVR